MEHAITEMEPGSGQVYETKFVLPNSTAHAIVRWLQCRCHSDREFPAGIVSSIYYDSRDWRCLREKINSDYLKTKIRLRWYADIDSEEPEEASFLEAKYKTGSRREKIRIKTEFSGKWLARVNLNNSKLLSVPQLLLPAGVIVGGGLIPAFQISYRRRRFVEPTTGLRLCLDYDISAPKVNYQMLGRHIPFRLQQAVLELKGSGLRPDGTAVGANHNPNELPEVLGQLAALGCRKQSFSKYCKCYQKIMGIIF